MPEFHRWTESERIAYAAGIIDGEGCITIPRTPSGRFRLYIQVSQHVKGWALLDFLQENFDAKCDSQYQSAGNRSLKRTAFWGGDPGCLFLKKIRPFLLIKDRQADIGIEFQEMINSKVRRGNYFYWTSETAKLADSLSQQIKLLNSKGKGKQLAF